MTEFEENWLQFVSRMGLDVGPDGICPFLDIYETKCRIYKERPTTCRGFPFTLRKKEDKGYRLVIHKGCPGSGKGPEIDQEAWIKRLVRLANKQFDKGYKIEKMEKKKKHFVVFLE
jgi:Fe-S-cluster containining protein